MRANRTLTIELRLLDIDDEQHEACKDLMFNLAQDLLASATLLCGHSSNPRVFLNGPGYRIDIAKEAPVIENMARLEIEKDTNQ